LWAARLGAIDVIIGIAEEKECCGIALGSNQVTGTQDAFAGLQGLASNRRIGPVELRIEAQVSPEACHQVQCGPNLAMPLDNQVTTAHFEGLSAIRPLPAGS
jgi:hypothetical protein